MEAAKSIQIAKDDCERKMGDMKFRCEAAREQSELGYLAKEKELRVATTELTQTREFMFNIHSHINFYHDSLLKHCEPAAKAKTEFEEKKRKIQNPK